MAEEKKTSGNSFEDLMLMLFAIVLVGQMFQRGPEIIREHFGVDVKAPKLLVAGAVVSDNTPLGTRVNVPGGTPFYDTAGDTGTQLGTFLPGSTCTIVGGPEKVHGETWWEVEDSTTGKKGWVLGSSIILDGVGGIGPTTKIGSRARVLLDTDVWSAPGGIEKIASVKLGDVGVLTKGPQSENGSRWWFFDKDKTDEDGWISEGVLLLASNTAWKEGSTVQTVHSTNIFERAGGGQILGFLEEEEKAKILGGPVEVGGTFWWFVLSDKKIEGWVEENALEDGGVKGWFKGFLAVVMIIGSLLTLGLLAGIIYITIRTNQIRAREVAKVKAALSKGVKPRSNIRWDTVTRHVQSENPGDWRLAIIEADIILDELLTKMGYHGDTLGEKLKQVAKGDLKSIDQAWEAHKIRNQIAHEGGDFILTQRETKRVIDMYTAVFSELKYI
jgi:hypothetical protein